MKNLLRFLSILAVTLWLSLTASNAFGQTEDKPICISRAAAETCATNTEKIKALEAHILVLEQALKDERKLNTDLRVEVALNTGKIIGCEQGRARDSAIIEILIKYARPKTNGIKIF